MDRPLYDWLFLVFFCNLADDSRASSCPVSSCKCEPSHQGVRINCRRLFLFQLPKVKPSEDSFEELSLQKNNIRTVPENAFLGLRVKAIDLSENMVSSIHDEAFRGLESSLVSLKLRFHSCGGLPTKALRRLSKLETLHLSGCTSSVLANHSFSGFGSLRELHITSCRVSDIEPLAFAGVERSLRVLNLMANSLTSVPSASLSRLRGLRKLTLSRNRIAGVPTTAFPPLPSLAHLDLSVNVLRHIAPDALRGARAPLEFLSLQNNRLNESALAAVRGLTELRQLELASNEIRSIIPRTFQFTNKISIVSFQSNKIETLQPGSLLGCEETLEVLLLADNPLEKLPENLFSSFKRLRHLYLDGTRLGPSLSPATFRGLENSLETMSLRGAGLVPTALASVKRLKRMEILKLCDNEITHIPDFAFLEMRNLKRLDLSGNRLSLIRGNTFRGLENSLRQLVLRRNNIETFSRCTFEGFRFLLDIALAYNPLRCDCHLIWLKDWVDKRYDRFRRAAVDWRCRGPTAKLSHKLFRSLTRSDFGCENFAAPGCDAAELSNITSAAEGRSGEVSRRGEESAAVVAKPANYTVAPAEPDTGSGRSPTLAGAPPSFLSIGEAASSHFPPAQLLGNDASARKTGIHGNEELTETTGTGPTSGLRELTSVEVPELAAILGGTAEGSADYFTYDEVEQPNADRKPLLSSLVHPANRIDPSARGQKVRNTDSGPSLPRGAADRSSSMATPGENPGKRESARPAPSTHLEFTETASYTGRSTTASVSSSPAPPSDETVKPVVLIQQTMSRQQPLNDPESRADNQTGDTRPLDFSVEVLSSSSVLLTWNAGINDSRLAGFRILHRQANGTSTPLSAFLPVIKTAYHVSNLRPNTSYDVCVAVLSANESAHRKKCRRLELRATAPSAQRSLREGVRENLALAICSYVGGALLFVCAILVVAIYLRQCERKKREKFGEPEPPTWTEITYKTPYNAFHFPSHGNTPLATFLSNPEMPESEPSEDGSLCGGQSDGYSLNCTFTSDLPAQHIWSISNWRTGFYG